MSWELVAWNPEPWTWIQTATGELATTTAWSVWIVVNNPEGLDTNGYFTALVQNLDHSDVSVKSLHARLAEMDALLWSSTDFPHTQIQSLLNTLEDEWERIKHIEWLILRLALVLQSLNVRLKNFVQWASTWEKREILISTEGNASSWKTPLDPNNKDTRLRLVIWDSPIDETIWKQALYRNSFPIVFKDDAFGIKISSTLAIHINQGGTMRGSLPMQSQNGWWRTERYLSLVHGKMSSQEPFHYQYLYNNEKIDCVIDSEMTIDVYDIILKKLQALLLQMGDIWELFNTATQARIWNPRKQPPIIHF